MNCELCGFTDDKFYKTEIEGSVMVVCSKCSSFGKVVGDVESEQKIEQRPQKSYSFVEKSLRLDYAETLRKALSEKQITVEKLADSIKESPYELKKVVSGRIIPTDSTAEKLEKTLGVSLYEDTVGTFESRTAENSVSLGDVVQIKQKKQG